jgi:hypothetical protein
VRAACRAEERRHDERQQKATTHEARQATSV